MTGLSRAFRYAPTLVLRAGVRFIAIYAFTRLLSPEDYGRYTLVLACAALAQLTLFSWIEASALRFFVRARTKGWLHRLAGSLRAAAGAAVLLLGLGVGSGVALAPEGLKPFVAAGGALVLLTFLANIRRETLRAEERTTRYLLIDGAVKLGGLGAGIVLAWRTSLEGLSPIVGVVLASALVLAADRLTWSARPRVGRLSPRLIRQAARYGGPLSVALFADQMLSAGDRFVIAAVLGEAAVGSYAAGYGVATQLVGLIFLTVSLALSPAAIRVYETQGAEVAVRTAAAYGRGLVAVAVPACVGLMLVAEPLATLVVGEALRAQAGWIMVWVAPAGLLAGVTTHYFGQAFALTRRTGAQAGLMAAAAALNIGLNLWLVPLYGIAGALGATIAAYAAALVGSVVLGRRLLKLDLLIGPMLRALAAAGLMAGVVRLSPLEQIGAPALALAATAAVGAMVYGAAAWLTGGLDDFVPQRWRRGGLAPAAAL